MKSFSNAPFTLALSSGFFGFFAHVGFLKAMDEIGLRPSVYTGSSAGAIIAAAAAAGMNIKDIEKLTLAVSRDLFWDPSVGLGFLRGRKLQEFIAREVGDDFAALEKPLRISTFDIASRTTKVYTLGPLARIVRASCSVPLMFHPVRIDRRFYWDGGIQDKMAIHGIDPDEPILSHYLENRARDPHSLYELRRDDETVRGRFGKLVKMQLNGLPRSGPFALDRGTEIVDLAYRQSVELFKTSPKEVTSAPLKTT